MGGTMASRHGSAAAQPPCSLAPTHRSRPCAGGAATLLVRDDVAKVTLTGTLEPDGGLRLGTAPPDAKADSRAGGRGAAQRDWPTAITAARHHLPEPIGPSSRGSPRVMVSLGQMRPLACHVQNGVRFLASLGQLFDRASRRNLEEFNLARLSLALELLHDWQRRGLARARTRATRARRH